MKFQYTIIIFLLFFTFHCVLEPVKSPCEKSCDSKLAVCYAIFAKVNSGTDSPVNLVTPIFLCETLHSACNNVCYYE